MSHWYAVCTGVRGHKKQNPAEVDGGLFLLQPGQAWNPGGGGLGLLFLLVQIYLAEVLQGPQILQS